MNYERDLLRGALIPTAVVAIFTIGYSTWKFALPGALGAALAQCVIISYLILHLLVARATKNLDPLSTMSLALVSYFGKIVLLGLFLLAVSRLTTDATLDKSSFAVAAIAGTFAWLFGEIRAYLRLKLHLPLPQDLPGQEKSGQSSDGKGGDDAS